MINLMLTIGSIINTVAMGIYLSFVSNDIVPTHFGIDGTPDEYGSKWTYLTISAIPFMIAVMNILSSVLLKKNEKYNKNKKYLNRLFIVMFVILVAIVWITTLTSINGLYADNLPPMFISILFGVAMAFVSNMFPKLKQNSTFGIKTIPTLKSEVVWKKTHKLAGYTGVAGGIIMVVCGLLGIAFSDLSYAFMFTGMGIYVVIGAFIPMIYAHIIYVKEKLK